MFKKEEIVEKIAKHIATESKLNPSLKNSIWAKNPNVICFTIEKDHYYNDNFYVPYSELTITYVNTETEDTSMGTIHFGKYGSIVIGDQKLRKYIMDQKKLREFLEKFVEEDLKYINFSSITIWKDGTVEMHQRR
jgi:hypothetical protein